MIKAALMIIALAFIAYVVAGCANPNPIVITPPSKDYEICNTSNCGDNVEIKVE